jgi:hypothetical protein
LFRTYFCLFLTRLVNVFLSKGHIGIKHVKGGIELSENKFVGQTGLLFFFFFFISKSQPLPDKKYEQSVHFQGPNRLILNWYKLKLDVNYWDVLFHTLTLSSLSADYTILFLHR